MTDWKIKGGEWVVLEELDSSHLLNIERWLLDAPNHTSVPVVRLDYFLAATRTVLARRGVAPLPPAHAHEWQPSMWRDMDGQTVVSEWTCTICLVSMRR